MTRLVALLIWLFLSAVPCWAAGEIGYVEDFNGLPSRYIVHRGGQEVPMRLCLPLYKDDIIEARDDKGRVTLRLIDHPEPIIWSRADKDTKLSADPSQTSSWPDFLGSMLATLSPFDEQKRERVLTTIRDDGGEFDVPLLQGGQVLAAGQRSLTIGWLKASAVTEISIMAKDGRKLVTKAKGTGGLWVSPVLTLKPGQYQVTVASGSSEASGNLDVVAPTELPKTPDQLTQATIPEPLRNVAQAVWLSAQDGGRYRLEALQLIANDRGTRPAAALAEALIAGKSIEMPK